MKCPQNSTSCNPTLIFRAQNKKDYVCSGLNKHPQKYKEDIISLCLKSSALKEPVEVQMTLEEALFITSVLMATIGFLVPGISKHEKNKWIEKVRGKK